ncbi:MAG: agmatinase [Dehalococcoidia bacterium]|nr:agmatinase [Dehalococcoidia bacterium]MSQ16244.1 agmatinase [Dehalococcoidia bacterium]
MAESPSRDLPWVPRNFLALPEEQSALESSRVVLLPVPYDSTTSFRTGARYGPEAIIEASSALEDFDWELDLDLSEVGIYTAPLLEPHVGYPGVMVARIREAVGSFLAQGKVVGVLGGEHSVCIGASQAHLARHPEMSVLYLDAHADLRDQYLGTPYSHASGARRIHEKCPLVLAGLRSMCQEERDYIRANAIPAFFWPPVGGDEQAFIRQVVAALSPEVYLSVDLDVLDPSFMSAVGTPEPGGMSWQQINNLLRAVAQERHIVGFDVNELSPKEGPAACSYIAAKLVYKLVAYCTLVRDRAHGS